MHVAVAQSENFFMLFLRSKLTVVGIGMERYGNGEAIYPLKEDIFSNRINPARGRRAAPSRAAASQRLTERRLRPRRTP
jgi:hypothetical protein